MSEYREKCLESISSAEARWGKILYGHCRKLFAGVFLPSHDQRHHTRVWSHARTLMVLMLDAGIQWPPDLPEQVLIASFFHDMGLTLTSGERHGRQSRQLCEEFFKKAVSLPDNPDPDSLAQILETIEYHDDKSLREAEGGRGQPPQLLRILGTADDLDAFGYTGIYRYAEVYLLRGMEPEQLPGPVCSNVMTRFVNIKNAWGDFQEFISQHEKRFLQVYDFYLQLAQAIAERDERPSWQPVLVELILEATRKKQDLMDPKRVIPPGEFEGMIRAWFSAMDRENSGVDHFT